MSPADAGVLPADVACFSPTSLSESLGSKNVAGEKHLQRLGA